MWRHVAIGFALWSAGVGCACLEVKKVSEEKRQAGSDHVKGFRYYLSRPYVVVQAPILVCESSTLYVVSDRPEHLTVPPAEDKTRPGKPPELGQEKILRINPASGAFESVSDVELAALRKMASSAAAGQAAARAEPPPPLLIAPGPGGLSAAGAAADAAADATAAVAAQGQARSRADSASNGGGSPNIPTFSSDPTLTERKTAQLNGNIQVVFLPDLDEQYAVHNCNVLSKSAYALYFRDGWQLSDVTGEFDSTAVPLEILNFIDKAIESAKGVALAGVDRQARILGAADVGVTKVPALRGGATVYRLVTSTYLKPGVYRVNKPWEINGEHPADGCGLLAKMGLATFDTARVEMNPDLRTLADIKQDCPAK
jgi:hypothetical protein